VTESEWLAGTDPEALLTFLLDSGRATDRKLRLFSVACCRRVSFLMTDPRHRRVVEAAEQFADGRLTAAELEAALDPVIALWAELPPAGRWEPVHYLTGATRHLDEGDCAPWAASYSARARASQTCDKDSPGWWDARRPEDAAQCHLLRDVFGPLPFHPVAIDAAVLQWGGGTVPAIARRIYEERAFHDLPILADALEDAGCQDQDILGHCRSGGEHVRGCWVVDALLGKG
jgi:hypothetical protein